MLVDTRLVSVGMAISIYIGHLKIYHLMSWLALILYLWKMYPLQSRFASGLQRLISPTGMLYNENFNQVEYIKTKAMWNMVHTIGWGKIMMPWRRCNGDTETQMSYHPSSRHKLATHPGSIFGRCAGVVGAILWKPSLILSLGDYRATKGQLAT